MDWIWHSWLSEWGTLHPRVVRSLGNVIFPSVSWFQPSGLRSMMAKQAASHGQSSFHVFDNPLSWTPQRGQMGILPSMAKIRPVAGQPHVAPTPDLAKERLEARNCRAKLQTRVDGSPR